VNTKNFFEKFLFEIKCALLCLPSQQEEEVTAVLFACVLDMKMSLVSSAGNLVFH